ncbi:LIC_13387 family protein [Arenimonas sp.]|uniref:LIC_13387 family protein n=1 Tax=Arenimonas sp. TaxID=1872635 RepID=UPI0039E5D90B
MIATVLMSISAGIFLLLGTMHLLYTFNGPKFMPRDRSLMERMAEVSPVISAQTTMWRCWIGFNASHSLGAMLFGLIYGYLALAHPTLLFGSPYLLGVGLAMAGAFLLLGKAYWFSIPFTGIALSLACFIGGVVAAHV